jgi:hypothetical protein
MRQESEVRTQGVSRSFVNSRGWHGGEHGASDDPVGSRMAGDGKKPRVSRKRGSTPALRECAHVERQVLE